MNSKKTLWLDIKGHEGFYQVSNEGQVRRMNPDGTPRRLITPSKEKDGRLSVSLSKNGSHKRYRIHRLVLCAFKGERKYPEFEVRHLDGDNQNNNEKNLEWGTHQENEQDKLAHGTRHAGHGELKLNEEAVRNIRKSSLSSHALGRMFAVDHKTILKVKSRKTWKHVED